MLYYRATVHPGSTFGNIHIEIDHGGSIYTTQIFKCYKSWPLILANPVVKYLLAHNWMLPSLFVQKINNWNQYKIIKMVLNAITHLQMAAFLFLFLTSLETLIRLSVTFDVCILFIIKLFSHRDVFKNVSLCCLAREMLAMQLQHEQ